LKDTPALHWIARGPAMAAAHQAELTFMEGARMTCRAFTGGGFRHGPFELAGQEHCCVMLIPGGRTQSLLLGMAEELAGKSPLAMRYCKAAVNAASNTDVATGQGIERDLFALAFASDDQSEGMSAYFEKRTPEFTGR